MKGMRRRRCSWHPGGARPGFGADYPLEDEAGRIAELRGAAEPVLVID